jgi:hypothetical protein
MVSESECPGPLATPAAAATQDPPAKLATHGVPATQRARLPGPVSTQPPLPSLVALSPCIAGSRAGPPVPDFVLVARYPHVAYSTQQPG